MIPPCGAHDTDIARFLSSARSSNTGGARSAGAPPTASTVPGGRSCTAPTPVASVPIAGGGTTTLERCRCVITVLPAHSSHSVGGMRCALRVISWPTLPIVAAGGRRCAARLRNRRTTGPPVERITSSSRRARGLPNLCPAGDFASRSAGHRRCHPSRPAALATECRGVGTSIHRSPRTRPPTASQR